MVLETLRRLYPELTPAQQVLADYVSRCYREVAFMTAARVAKAVAMNEATVIRFAQRLGYEGYPEMQEAIQAAVLAELQGPQSPTEPRSFVEVFRTCLVRSSERTSSVASLVSPEAVDRAVSMLVTTSEVLVIGAGDGITVGDHVTRRLRALGLRAQAVTADPENLARALAGVRPGHAVIGCGGTEGSTTIAKALEAAKASGGRTLALSYTPLAPEAQMADVAMAPPPSDDGLAPGLAILVALADALAQTLLAALPDGQERLERVSAMREQLGQD